MSDKNNEVLAEHLLEAEIDIANDEIPEGGENS